MTFLGPERAGQELGQESGQVSGDGVEPDGDWQPIPLELPLDVPYRRQHPMPAGQSPRGGDHKPDPDGDAGGRVIIIDLA
jgi:hypothetical protein